MGYGKAIHPKVYFYIDFTPDQINHQDSPSKLCYHDEIMVYGLSPKSESQKHLKLSTSVHLL